MEKRLDLWDAFPIYGYEKGTLISKEKGCMTIPLQLVLPEAYTLDKKDFVRLQELFYNIIHVLGPHSMLHRQDYFTQECYRPMPKRLQGDFLERANEHYFEDRPFLEATHYLYLSKVPKNYIRLNSNRVNSHLSKNREFYLTHSVPEEFMDSIYIESFKTQVNQVIKLINESGLIEVHRLGYDDLFDIQGIYARYYGLLDRSGNLGDVNFRGNDIRVGTRSAQFFTLENLEQFTKDHITPFEYYAGYTTDKNPFPIGNLFSLGFKIPCEHIINQYIYIPDQEKVLTQFRKKIKRFQKFSSGKTTDANHIHAGQVQSYIGDLLENHKQTVYYHLNVMGISNGRENTNHISNSVTTAFKRLRIQAKYNTLDRKNLFFGGVPGHSIGLPTELFLPMASDMAASLLYFEGGPKESTRFEEKFRLVDRITGRPLYVSMYREPEKKHWIFNRGMLVASGSGGGKSYWTNHYIASELRKGGEAILMEDGHSYDKLTEVFNGVILEHRDDAPFTFNPFLLDSHDVQVSDLGKKRLTEGKLLFLVTLLQLITNEDRMPKESEVKSTLLEHLITSYYDTQWQSETQHFKFDSFFEFAKTSLFSLIRTHSISQEVFDPHVFLFLLQKYHSTGVRGKLLNQADERLAGLSSKKLVYFKMGHLIDNALLFPITALMIMDLFNKKMQDPGKLTINKILAVDEAWKALERPELAHYFNAQSRMARKLGGQPIFISQKVDDFVSSEIIRDAIVVNSHIKVFLDMRDFSASFDRIQALLGLGEKQKQLILSLNKDTPEDRSFREVAICWMDRVRVYGVETSLEERCIYETNPNDCETIKHLHEEHQEHWPLTAKAYAFYKTKK